MVLILELHFRDDFRLSCLTLCEFKMFKFKAAVNTQKNSVLKKYLVTSLTNFKDLKKDNMYYQVPTVGSDYSTVFAFHKQQVHV